VARSGDSNLVFQIGGFRRQLVEVGVFHFSMLLILGGPREEEREVHAGSDKLRDDTVELGSLAIGSVNVERGIEHLLQQALDQICGLKVHPA